MDTQKAKEQLEVVSFLADYYPNADPRKLHTLEKLWIFVKSIEPNAVEGLSYGLPALKLNNRPLIGFAIIKDGLSLYPFSPKIISQLKPKLANFETGKGVIRFTEDNPFPESLVELILDLRKEQIFQ